MKCFYHQSDFDGQCSAAIVRYAFPECEPMPITHGDSFPFDALQAGETIYMVDFCLPMELMVRLSQRSELIWIDHHKSAVEEAEEIGFNPKGLRRIGQAACELTWQFLFPNTGLPHAVYLLGRCDVWDLEADPAVLPFHFGMGLQDTEPSSALWPKLFAQDAALEKRVIRQGKVISQYCNRENEKRARWCSFETTLQGVRAIAINAGLTNADVFKGVWDPSRHDLMVTFCWMSKGLWKVTMYTEKPDIDCSALARKFGGGGHKGAAGFECRDLPFALAA
jgi:uncharacterized protein